MSLKASLKSVIAEMDSFGAVKKRESHHSFSLLSQGIWELHRDIYRENMLWTKTPLISEKAQERTGTEKKKKKKYLGLWFTRATSGFFRNWEWQKKMDDRLKYWIYLFIPQVAIFSFQQIPATTRKIKRTTAVLGLMSHCGKDTIHHRSQVLVSIL